MSKLRLNPQYQIFHSAWQYALGLLTHYFKPAQNPTVLIYSINHAIFFSVSFPTEKKVGREINEESNLKQRMWPPL